MARSTIHARLPNAPTPTPTHARFTPPHPHLSPCIHTPLPRLRLLLVARCRCRCCCCCCCCCSLRQTRTQGLGCRLLWLPLVSLPPQARTFFKVAKLPHLSNGVPFPFSFSHHPRRLPILDCLTHSCGVQYLPPSPLSPSAQSPFLRVSCDLKSSIFRLVLRNTEQRRRISEIPTNSTPTIRDLAYSRIIA